MHATFVEMYGIAQKNAVTDTMVWIIAKVHSQAGKLERWPSCVQNYL